MLRIFFTLLITGSINTVIAIDRAELLFRESRHAKDEKAHKSLLNEIRQKFPDSKHAALLKFMDTEFPEPRSEYKRLRAIDSILRRWPDFPDAYLMRGFIRIQTASKEKADEDYRRFRAAGFRENFSETLMGGIIYLKLEKYEESIVKFNEAILLRPEEVEPYHWRGKAFLGMGKNPEAIRDFVSCLADRRRQEMEHECLAQRGQAFLNQKQFAEALNDFQAAGKLAPSESDDSTGLAQALFGLKRYGEAEQAALSAINKNPKDALAYLILAVLSDLKGNCSDVKMYIQKQRAVHPLVFTGHKFICSF